MTNLLTFPVTKQGYYLPWGVFSGVSTAIGAGLISMWTPSTGSGKWIGYQIVFGVGRGAGMQVASTRRKKRVDGHTDASQPIVAIQNAVAPAQIPISMAVFIFFQNFSTSVAAVISNVIFAQALTKSISQHAPSVSPQAALKAGSGATAVRNIVPAGHEGELPGVLKAYTISLRNVFYLLSSLAVVATVASFALGWKDVRKKQPIAEKAQARDKSGDV